MTTLSNLNQCLSTLTGIESQLNILVKNTQEEEAKKIFQETMQQVDEIKKDLIERRQELGREEPIKIHT